MGRVSIDRVSIGRVSVGWVSVGWVSVGSVSIDRVSVGRVSVGRVSVSDVGCLCVPVIRFNHHLALPFCVECSTHTVAGLGHHHLYFIQCIHL